MRSINPSQQSVGSITNQSNHFENVRGVQRSSTNKSGGKKRRIFTSASTKKIISIKIQRRQPTHLPVITESDSSCLLGQSMSQRSKVA